MSDTPKIAFVTGGSSGIGYSIAEELIRRNYQVCLFARDAKTLKLASDKLSALDQNYPQVIQIVGDVSNPHDIQRALDQAWSLYNRLDVVIHSAGIGYFNNVSNSDASAAKQVFETNTLGTFNLLNKLQPYLKHKQSCHIVYISSLAAMIGLPGQGLYCASKSAATKIFEAFLLEQENKWTSGTIVFPGRTNTSFRSRLAEGSSTDALSKNNMLDFMDPATLSRIIVRAISSKKRLVVCGKLNHCFYLTAKHFPSLIRLALKFSMTRTFQKCPTEKEKIS